VESGGSSIAVHCTASDGPAIVLCHGNSASSRAFEKQLDGELGERFRLIAIDWPGHGDSSRAAEPETTYTLPGYARVLCDVVKALDVGTAVFVGWSLGGHVVLEAAPDLPRAAGRLVFGAPPVGKPADMARAFRPDPVIGAAFREQSSEEEINALLAAFLAPGTAVPAWSLEDFKRTDGTARAIVGASIGRGDFRDEVRVVAESATPLAILHGEHDRLVDRGYLDELAFAKLWRGSVQDMAGVGHTLQWEGAAAFDPLLEAFARDCLR
jgi:pimeloyl-ACP methyl ester carboxylesterase